MLNIFFSILPIIPFMDWPNLAILFPEVSGYLFLFMNKMYFQTHEKEIPMVKTKTSIQCVFIFFENHIDGIIKVYSWIKNQLWSHLFIFASVISD